LATLRNSDGQNILTAQLSSGLYLVKASNFAFAHIASTDLLNDWHERLGHLNVRDVMRLGRWNRLDGLGQVSQTDIHEFRCEACIMGKGTRLSAPPSNIRAAKPLEIVHIDLWGPARTASVGGCKYFLTCYDDYTRKIHLSFLKNKSDSFKNVIEYIATVERQLSTKVKCIRSDNGGEFTSNAFTTFMQQHGIEHITVPPYSHAQNGRVEQVHLTILNGVRTVLTHSGLPAHFWAEAAAYTVYTRNRVPCGPLHEIPEDKWRNRTLSHQHMQPFGCKAFYRDHKLPSKLAPQYIEGILLGYVVGTHNYRIWDNKRSKVIISRDVVFTTQPVNSGVLTPVDNNIVPDSHTKTGSDQITLI